MTTDADLLRSFARDGSEAALAELVRRHIDFVYASALRRLNGDAHGARDVTQAVFIDLSRKAGKLSGHTVLTGWLHTSARYAAANVARAEGRRRRHEEEATTMHDLQSTPEPDWSELRPVIDEALDRLNPRDREAVLLRFFEGRTLASVGAALSLSEDATRMRVDRALEKLRAALARRGVKSTAGALTAILVAQPVVAAPAGLAAAITSGALAPAAAAAVAAGAAGAGAFGFLKGVGALKTILTASAVGVVTVAAVVAMSSKPSTQSASSQAVERGSLPPAAAQLAQQIPAMSSAAAPSGVPRAASPGGDQPKTRVTLTKAARDERRDSAAYREQLVALARARLDANYGVLFRRLGLSGASLETFKDLLIEKQQTKLDVANMLRAQGRLRRGEAVSFHEVVAENQRETDAQIKALLGDAGHAAYLQYEFNYNRRVTVGLLQESLKGRDPLTADQVERLVEAMGTVAYHTPQTLSTGLGLEAGAGLSPEPINLITKDALLVAKPILSSTQWDAFRALQRELHAKYR